MKPILITIVVVTALILIGAVKDVSPSNIVEAIPFLGGEKPGIYHVGGLIMIVLALNGFRRLGRNSHSDSGGFTFSDHTPDDNQDADDSTPPPTP